MAIIKQGILGGGSGTVGTVVMTAWKGRAIVKSLPLSVANPKSTGQVSQRTKFKSVTQLGSTLLTDYVQKIENVLSGNITGYNRFCSRNKAAFSSVGAFVPTSFFVGGGSRPSIAGISDVEVGAADALNIEYTRAAGEAATYDTDKAVFIAICPSTMDIWVSPGTENKSALTSSMALKTGGSDLTGELQVYFYPCLLSADGRGISVSQSGTMKLVTFA